MIIYKITNTITQKSYIGQTIRTLKKRWADHKKYSKNPKNHFQRAIAKYPEDSWKFLILEEIHVAEMLNEREIFWIEFYDSFNNGYNSTIGGKQNVKFSDDVLKRMSEAGLGKHKSEETKEKIRQANLGKIVSEQTRAKMSQLWKGVKRPYKKRGPYKKSVPPFYSTEAHLLR